MPTRSCITSGTPSPHRTRSIPPSTTWTTSRTDYTVSAQNPIYTSIYYLDHQPDRFSDYSHNPYSFTPHVDVDLAPGKPWGFDLDMSDPDHYAMVVASTGTEPGTPGLHCDLAVDGAVVVSKDGPKGVLCSLRNW